jgi:hypothetical protein
MLENFFARKVNDRQRSTELRSLNAVLSGSRKSDTVTDVACSGYGDTATCLPSGFVNKSSDQSEQG